MDDKSDYVSEVTRWAASRLRWLNYGNIPLLKILAQGPVDSSKDICKMTKGPRKVKLVIVVNNKKE